MEEGSTQRVQQYLELKSKEPVGLMHIHLEMHHTNQQLFVTQVHPGLELPSSEAALSSHLSLRCCFRGSTGAQRA